jgi:hypothetical protein
MCIVKEIYMAEAYLETTEWVEVKACNHTYYLEGDKMLAYVRYGTTEPFWFNKPITISRSGRKFQRVDSTVFDTSLGIIDTLLPRPDPDVVEVKGSKPGAVYLVNLKENTCTCPGYTYRGQCKHVKETV